MAVSKFRGVERDAGKLLLYSDVRGTPKLLMKLGVGKSKLSLVDAEIIATLKRSKVADLELLSHRMRWGELANTDLAG